MNVLFEKQISGEICTVTVSTGNFTYPEQLLMQKIGEPLVEMGGEFYSPLSSTPLPRPSVPNATPNPRLVPLYIHSTLQKMIQTDFGNVRVPYKVVFDGNNLGVSTAIADANIWIATMKLRFEQAMATLRAQADNFTGTDSDLI